MKIRGCWSHKGGLEVTHSYIAGRQRSKVTRSPTVLRSHESWPFKLYLCWISSVALCLCVFISGHTRLSLCLKGQRSHTHTGVLLQVTGFSSQVKLNHSLPYLFFHCIGVLHNSTTFLSIDRTKDLVQQFQMLSSTVSVDVLGDFQYFFLYFFFLTVSLNFVLSRNLKKSLPISWLLVVKFSPLFFSFVQLGCYLFFL